MGAPSFCPFCGNRYTAVKSDGYYDGEHEVPWFQVVCHRCEARGPRTYGANGYELAMAEWDRAGRLESTESEDVDR